MPIDMRSLRQMRGAILRTAEQYGARNVRVFGSVVRGEAHAGSDVDLLVEMDKGRGLFARGGLWVALEELLGCEVDLATDASLKPAIRERVLREAVPL